MPEVELSDGDRMHYEEKGAGLPVVLVHGFPLDGRIWEHQLAGLSDRHRVIVPDLRGFGGSRSTRPFTLADLADDLHQLLSRIGALPCVLGGLSMGGYVTFAFMTKYLNDLKGVLLIDTKCEADNAEQKAGRLKMIESLRAGGAKVVADAMEPKMLAPGAAQGRPDVAGRLRRIMEEQPPLTLEHALMAMRDREDYRDKLASCACPTLILVGDGDQITPPSGAEAMAREIPRAKLVVIKGAGHLAPMEQPEQVTRAVKEFLGEIA